MLSDAKISLSGHLLDEYSYRHSPRPAATCIKACK